jgi:EAL domain-containing protein (putative c-di-GMP-specific phosphodiesterase class I)
MGGFGTGSSSLSCLRSHAFDAVKVSQSSMRGLVSSRDSMALAHATLTLLENLGMASIAEGVDDAAQLAVLQSLGCRYAQGPLFDAAIGVRGPARAAPGASADAVPVAGHAA